MKWSVEPPLTLTLPLLPPVKEILYPVVSPSGLGGIQVNMVELFMITNFKLLGAEAAEGQHHALRIQQNVNGHRHTLHNERF